ncbi:Urease accessory protein UreF [Frankia canadensis]|uniref:Urease accessory protein UreF n=1 Tax=Frankia canadensis TaxID=1836972 RepID=A0A2I2KLA0_9ACTN|nr:urease accessory UreF family protein [Frankia canadensis]SNQ46424.1 Urease accessory protein UreF [Frankia canadensis]SOU53714.1 Urease accessory protein UreF [Frankia canadensis]
MTELSPDRPGLGAAAESAARRATLLVLADGRMPTGGHAHSGGVEAAVVEGSLADVSDLERFLLGRLHTAGVVAAAFAAATCLALAGDTGADPGIAELDAELDARTPSPAARAASRAQGRTLLRTGRAAWPVPPGPRAPHHPIALGMVCAGAGLAPADAALTAAHLTVTGPSTAATRLLGLDPIAVTAVTARLAGDVAGVARAGERAAGLPPRDLPAHTGIRLEHLAERHRLASPRMFTS